MFLNDSRVFQNNGIEFYEKDMLLTKNTFKNDIEIKINLDYKAPGFGLAIIPVNEITDKEKDYSYLFRLGNREYTISMNSINTKQTIKEGACLIANDNIEITYKKNNKNISLYINNKEIFDYNMKEFLNEFKLGLYSNKGNVIKSIEIKAGTPREWITNMSNTNGGTINFINNGFELKNCQNNAEIEQHRILLSKGKHYLKFESKDNEVIPYVFKSNDENILDELKNMLTPISIDKNNNNIYSFNLTEENEVNLKFKGKEGTINNICISENYDENFITKESKDSGLIKIDLENVKHIYIEGMITGIHRKKEYSIIETDNKILNINDLNLSFYNKYIYAIEIVGLTKMLSIYYKKDNIKLNEYNKEEPIFKDEIKAINSISLFKNTDITINELKIEDTKGNVRDFIREKTIKYYIDINSNGPIIISDNEESLDLSASYRIIDSTQKYIFTNYEREVFIPAFIMQTNKAISKKQGVIKLYAIKKDQKIEKKYLMHIEKEDTIDKYCKIYDTFLEEDLNVNKETGQIIFEKFNNYSEIVIDYLKAESYSINYIEGSKTVEVDISTQKNQLSMIYEDEENQSNASRIIDIEPNKNKYIAINKDIESTINKVTF